MKPNLLLLGSVSIFLFFTNYFSNIPKYNSEELNNNILKYSDEFNPIKCLSISPDGTKLASGWSNWNIKIWDVSNNKLFKTLGGHFHPVISLGFSSDGDKLISGSSDGIINIWDTKKWNIVKTIKEREFFFCVDASHNGNIVASSGTQKFIKVWDVNSGMIIKKIEAESSIYSLDFSPDGSMLAAGGLNGTIWIWMVKEGALFRILKGHTGSITSVCFSPDGNILATCSDDKTIIIWDVTNAKFIKRLEGHSGKIISANFSNDGKYLVSGSIDKSIKLWNIVDKNSKDSCITINTTTEVYSVNYSQDNNIIYSGGTDKCIKVWDIKESTILSSYTQNNIIKDDPESLQEIINQSPDGKTLNIKKSIYNKIMILGRNDLKIVFEKGVDLFADYNEETVHIENCKNITLKNGHFSHFATGCYSPVILIQNCSSITLDGCELDGCGIIGVIARKTYTLTIKNCYIHNNSDGAFFLDYVEDLQVTNNKFGYNGNQSDLESIKESIGTMRVENLVWKNNKFVKSY